jgi:hypothetical protein
MNLTSLTTTEIVLIIALALFAIGGLVAIFWQRNRRTGKLREQFGGAEYDRTLQQSGGSRRQAEAGLQGRALRVEALHLRELAEPDRARFMESWRKVQAHFVDGPAGAVTEADQLLGDVMSTRGYPVGNFEQRSADISVDHPLVLENYRTAHEIAVRQTQGQASTEELRQAMVHYRTLFDELVSKPEMPLQRG